MKYEIGDRVKVVRKVEKTGFYWNPLMDGTLGKVYTVLYITYTRKYRLDTKIKVGDEGEYNFIYLPESLEPAIVKGQQLEFDFMKGVL